MRNRQNRKNCVAKLLTSGRIVPIYLFCTQLRKAIVNSFQSSQGSSFEVPILRSVPARTCCVSAPIRNLPRLGDFVCLCRSAFFCVLIMK
eukprot:IDg6143t1